MRIQRFCLLTTLGSVTVFGACGPETHRATDNLEGAGGLNQPCVNGTCKSGLTCSAANICIMNRTSSDGGLTFDKDAGGSEDSRLPYFEDADVTRDAEATADAPFGDNDARPADDAHQGGDSELEACRASCQPAGPCLTAECVPVADGTLKCQRGLKGPKELCKDDDPCTHSERCNGKGDCIGQPIKCTDDPDEVCGIKRQCQDTPECKLIKPKAGTPCSTGDQCYKNDTCQILVRDNREEGVCHKGDVNVGEPCTLKDACFVNPTCQQDGSCKGTPRQGPFTLFDNTYRPGGGWWSKPHVETKKRPEGIHRIEIVGGDQYPRSDADYTGYCHVSWGTGHLTSWNTTAKPGDYGYRTTDNQQYCPPFGATCSGVKGKCPRQLFGDDGTVDACFNGGGDPWYMFTRAAVVNLPPNAEIKLTSQRFHGGGGGVHCLVRAYCE